MLVSFKTLTNAVFKVELAPTDTIKEVKEKIHREKGEDYRPENQKLILLGKVLEDNKTVGEYSITEASSIVCFATKPKPAAAAPAPPAPAAVQSTPVVAPTPAAAAPAPATAPAPTPAPAATTPAAPAAPAAQRPAAAGGDSGLVVGEAYEGAVQEMMSMGFPRAQIEAAMRASFNNPDRAMEYLLSGNIPASAGGGAEEAGDEQSGDDNYSDTETTGAVRAPATGEDPLAFLRTQPQFAQMRQLIQQNPALLAPLLQQLAQSNPQLLQLINEHQNEFYNMISEPEAGGEGGAVPAAAEAGAPAGGRQPGASYITVTAAEREAIDRLKALGFPEAMCIQAYFACEKNENLAANFLLSQNDED